MAKKKHNQDNILIIYDDLTVAKEFECGKGFSCLVTIAGKKILFDLGGDFDKFMHNCDRANIDLSSINQVVISHRHWDHCNGLAVLITKLSVSCQIVLPKSFAGKVPTDDQRVHYVNGGGLNPISSGVFTLAFNARWWGIPIVEQALIVEHEQGLIILTGCAHAGILKIIQEVEQRFQRRIYLVIGGFHLGYSSRATITKLIETLNQKDILQLAPCHCSGTIGRQLFKELFQRQVHEIGSGILIFL